MGLLPILIDPLPQQLDMFQQGALTQRSIQLIVGKADFGPHCATDIKTSVGEWGSLASPMAQGGRD